ncbi:MAG TPA: guanylate kinase [Steroidobacteraceae bacterium]
MDPGRLFVIAAPSGAGKTTLVQALLKGDPNLRGSVSHTTRKQRPTEQHGRDYFFVDESGFCKLRDEGAFLEHAQVFDNFYGTGRAEVDRARAAGHDVLLEIDWQGARQVRASAPDCATIFILPPSRRALEDRLRNRKTDTNDVIARRLREAVTDMSHYREFDYVVVNDDFEHAVAQLRDILAGRGQTLRSARSELAPLVKELLA